MPFISHPLRVRGLKHADLVCFPKAQFAPITGAWIETICAGAADAEDVSHPLRVRGLKPHCLELNPAPAISHPLRVRGLKLFTISL